MKYYFKLVGVLCIISALASGMLAFVNKKTKPIIDELNRKAELEARSYVLPKAFSFIKQEEEDFVYFVAKNDTGGIIGYTFVAVGTGYSGNIKTMVGIEKDFSINSIKIISQSETPGLGANCAKNSWQDQFSGVSSKNLMVEKDGGVIVSITGSTITSRAVATSIKKGIKLIETYLVRKGSSQ